MTPAEIKTIEKTLDTLESGFLAAEIRAVKKEVMPELEHDVERIFRDGKIDAGSFELPGKKRYKRLFQRFLWSCWAQGYKLAWNELKAKEKTAKHASEVTPDPVIPEAAIKKIDRWTDIFGDRYYGDVTGDVVNVLRNSLREGLTTKETMLNLSEYLSGPGYNRGRLEVIARTNATTFFNQGRLSQFEQNKDFVTAVEYMAILDSRTTQVCRDRDGKVMLLDDPSLPANTPPLHYNCRSILSPIDKYEWEEMQAPGWKDTLGKAGHNRTLAEKMDWSTGADGGKLASPAKGFGEGLNIEKSLKKQAENSIINKEQQKLNLWIDELTPCLIDSKTGDILKTSVSKIETIEEIYKIQKENKWEFDWVNQWKEKESNSEFYKLTLVEEVKSQGIIEIRLQQGCVEAVLVESAPENIGSQGKYKGVGGHLFAIAVKRSIETDGNGIVWFNAKTGLIEHYKKELGAEIYFNDNMAIKGKSSQELYEKYFGVFDD